MSSKKHNIEPEYITFLREIKMLKSWPITKLPHHDARICLSSYFRKGVVICNNNLNNEWIYVIKQGTCRILKGFQISKDDKLLVRKPGENIEKRTSKKLIFVYKK